MSCAVNPITVTFPAGAIVSSAPILLDAAEPLVVNTPFAPWTPIAAVAGAPARVSMALFQALRLFIAPCSVGPAPADLVASTAVSIWRFRLSVAAWSRILTELRRSGYADTSISSLRASDVLLHSLVPVTPNDLHIVAGDFALAQDFLIPAGAQHAAHRASLQSIAYLFFVNPVMLQREGGSPLRRLADLAGYLGPASTQAARYDSVGTPLASGVALSAACGPAALSDGLRARHVAKALDRLLLPTTLRSLSLTETDLASELEDGISFHSSDSDARQVLEQRVRLLAPR